MYKFKTMSLLLESGKPELMYWKWSCDQLKNFGTIFWAVKSVWKFWKQWFCEIGSHKTIKCEENFYNENTFVMRSVILYQLYNLKNV